MLRKELIYVEELYDSTLYGFTFYIRNCENKDNNTVKYFVSEKTISSYSLSIATFKNIIKDYCSRFGIEEGLKRLTGFLNSSTE